MAYFQKELEGKDVRIHSLNELMAHQDQERQQEHDALVRRHSEQVADLEQQLSQGETASSAKIQMLEDGAARGLRRHFSPWEESKKRDRHESPTTHMHLPRP